MFTNSKKVNMTDKINTTLQELGADFINFVNIKGLTTKANKNCSVAILFGLTLSRGYLQEVMDTPDYVQTMVRRNSDFSDDELYHTQLIADKMSDMMATLLKFSGYEAYSHSENNQIETGYFDRTALKTPLPHKTIARLASIGWIGKNNLIVSPYYGSAICFGMVSTNAPVHIVSDHPKKTECMNCNICVEMCKPKALKGHLWDLKTKREDMIDAHKCTACMNCLVFCPYTQNYINRNNNSYGKYKSVP